MERDDLGAMFARTTRRLIDAERPLLDAHDLSMWAYVALSYLAAAPTGTQLELARAIRYDKTRLVGLLDDLEDRGLVDRERDPDDRRARIVGITPAGLELLRRARSDVRAMETDVLDVLEPDAREPFVGHLARLAADAPGGRTTAEEPATDQQRADVERVATRMFAERGYAATTMDAIAREAGVAASTLRAHHGTKQELCIALLRRYRAELVAAPLGEFDPASTSPRDRLVPMIEAWLLHVREHPDAARLLLRPIAGDAEVERVQRELHARQRATQVALLREFLPELRAADAEPLGEVVRSALTAMAMWWLDRPDEPLDVPTRALVTTVEGLFAVVPQRSTGR